MPTAQLLLEKGRGISEVAKTAEEVFVKELSRINKFCMELSEGVYPIC
jgi:S-adenosylmethionine synthetase